MLSGIYTITSPSGKQYVGSAVSFRRRWTLHLSQLRRGKHHNKALSAAYLKYGEDGLKFRPIIVTTPDLLLLYEQLAIDALKPKYNRAVTAGSLLGMKASDHTKLKMSLSLKGIPRTEAQLAALAAGRASTKGRTHSIETRMKVSAAGLGRKHSAETRAAMSLLAKSRPRSEQQQAALRANRERTKTAEAIEKGRKTNVARMANPEERTRMSARTKAHHENNPLTEAQIAALAAGRGVLVLMRGARRAAKAQ